MIPYTEETNRMFAEARMDTATNYNVHVMFYYTNDFERSTSNILAYVNQVK